MTKAWNWFKDQTKTVKVIIVVAVVAILANLGGGDPVAEEVEATTKPGSSASSSRAEPRERCDSPDRREKRRR